MEIDELEQLLELLYGLDCAYVLDEKEEAAQNLLIKKVESIYEDEKQLRERATDTNVGGKEVR